eukprot:352554-Chlamydomonas_euryale.AAC.7
MSAEACTCMRTKRPHHPLNAATEIAVLVQYESQYPTVRCNAAAPVRSAGCLSVLQACAAVATGALLRQPPPAGCLQLTCKLKSEMFGMSCRNTGAAARLGTKAWTGELPEQQLTPEV